MNNTYNQEVSVFYYFIQVDRANQESVSEFYKYLMQSSDLTELLSKNEIWNEAERKEKTSTGVYHFDQVVLEQNELVEEEGIQKSNKALEQISQILNFILT